MTKTAALLVILAIVCLVFALSRHDSSDPVYVEASAPLATTTTAWPAETQPSLPESFAQYVEGATKPKPRPKARTAPKPVPTYRAQAATGPHGLFPTDELLHKLAMCETGGTMNQRATSKTNPPYLSFFQWALSTWHSMGGTGDPRDASYETQVPLARQLIMQSGWGQFPRCSRTIGARA